MSPKKRVKAAPAKTKAVEEEIDDLDEDDVEETPAPKKKAPAKKRVAKKPAPEPEPEEDDDDVEDEEEEAPAPKKRRVKAKPVVEDDDDEDDEEPAKAKRTPPKRAPIEYGTSWLAQHLEAKTGTAYTPYDLRVLLRKLAKKGILDRQIGVERARYEFSGAKDPVVVEIVKAVKSGEIEKTKKEALDNLKEKAAAKKAAAGQGPAKKKAKKPKVEEVEEDDVDLDEEDEDDEDVDELDD